MVAVNERSEGKHDQHGGDHSHQPDSLAGMDQIPINSCELIVSHFSLNLIHVKGPARSASPQAREPPAGSMMLEYDHPNQVSGVRRWRLLVVLAGYSAASQTYDLRRLPEHFLMPLAPPPATPTFSNFVHDVQVRLNVPYDFDIRPCFWERLRKKFVLLTEATFGDVLESIYNLITTNSHLDASGNLRGSAYIVLQLSYKSYDL